MKEIKNHLPADPEVYDLWKYVRGLRTKRLKKKFLNTLPLAYQIPQVPL